MDLQVRYAPHWPLGSVGLGALLGYEGFTYFSGWLQWVALIPGLLLVANGIGMGLRPYLFLDGDNLVHPMGSLGRGLRVPLDRLQIEDDTLTSPDISPTFSRSMAKPDEWTAFVAAVSTRRAAPDVTA